MVQTSTPTMKKIPKKSSRIFLSLSRARVFEILLSETIAVFCSVIGVAQSHRPEMRVMAPMIGKHRYHFCSSPPPKYVTARRTMYGPTNEHTALTTWAPVSAGVRNLSFVMTSLRRGMSDTCRMALPMPRRP